jgi:hypothetical protein
MVGPRGDLKWQLVQRRWNQFVYMRCFKMAARAARVGFVKFRIAYPSLIPFPLSDSFDIHYPARGCLFVYIAKV